jgi:hypothetical protein
MPENQIIENQAVEETITYDCIRMSSDLMTRIAAIKQTSLLARFILDLNNTYECIIGDLKTNLNYFGVSLDDPTKISYLTYDRAKSAINAGNSDRIWEDKNFRYHSSAGKVVRKLLESIVVENGLYKKNNVSYSSLYGCICNLLSAKGINDVPQGVYNLSTLFTEADYNDFNNLFRVEGFRQGDSGEVIFVKGHWIAELYHEKNYASISGTLGNSCMRYDRTNHYLDIYTKNPSVCKLAVLLNTQGKLQGRALVWTVDGVDYYDRIYATSDLIQDRMKAFFLVNGIETCYSGYSGYKAITISENLDLKDFDKRVILNHQYYPYMDSLKYLNETRTVISTEEYKVDESQYFILNCTGGGYETSRGSTFECSCCGRETDEDELCHIDVRRDDNYGEDLCSGCAVYSDYHSGYITRDEAVYIEGAEWVSREIAICDYDGEWIVADQAVELSDGTYAHENEPDLAEYENDRGYFLLSSTAFDYVEYNSEYYHPEDCVETRDGETIPAYLTTEHEGEVWLTENLKEHLNLNLL